MKGAEFSKVLIALAELANDAKARAAIHEISALFEKSGAQTVAMACKRLQALAMVPEDIEPATSSRDSLAQLLVHAQSLLQMAGARKVADDFKLVADCLRSSAAGSVRSWVQAALVQLATKATRSKPAAKKPAAASTVDAAAIIERYLGRLATVGWDAGAFEQAIGELSNDRSVPVAAVRVIGEKFSHLSTGKLSRAKVIDGIRKDFLSRLRTRNELDVVAKTKPW